MTDLIRREDAYAAIRGLTRHIDRIAAITAITAVQPDARIKQYEEAYQYAFHLAKALRENYPPNPDFRFLGDLVGLLTQIDNMVAGLPQPDAREAALREALAAVNAKWRSGAADTPDEMRGLALAEAAIFDLIEGGTHD